MTHPSLAECLHYSGRHSPHNTRRLPDIPVAVWLQSASCSAGDDEDNAAYFVRRAFKRSG
jgi:hypothetical protein